MEITQPDGAIGSGREASYLLMMLFYYNRFKYNLGKMLMDCCDLMTKNA